jgi:CheY-like chemotaxis protein
MNMSHMSVDHDAAVSTAAAKVETPADLGSSDAAWNVGGNAEPRFDGLRVLVVEDEYLVALLLAEDLRAAGCVIAGPHVSLAAANAAVQGEPFDVAILDVNLNGEMVYPLAEQLTDRGIPLVFLSGYDIGHFPERFRTAPRVAKPHDRAALLGEIARALRGDSE